jgi:hypothetical protein
MAKLRRAKVTSPATSGVVDIEWNENDSFDRRAADDEMSGTPVMTKQQGSGSITLLSGSLAKLYNHTLVVQAQEVSVADGVETVTTKTYTFTKVSSNRGLSFNNDGGESSAKTSFDFGTVTVA